MKRHLRENIVVVRFVTLVSENGSCKKLNPFCVLIFYFIYLHFFLRISSKILKNRCTNLSGSHKCWTKKLIKALLRSLPSRNFPWRFTFISRPNFELINKLKHSFLLLFEGGIGFIKEPSNHIFDWRYPHIWKCVPPPARGLLIK